MPTFLNLSLDGEINTKFFAKHLLFSIIWLIAILLFVFRIDVLLLDSTALQWLKSSLPLFYIFGLLVMFFFLRWYYSLAFLVYPLLLIFWFIPKAVLSKGKIYLFGKYVTSILSKLTHIKRTIFHLFIFTVSLVFFFSLSADWTRWLALIILSYFYLRYVFRLVVHSFQYPSLFDEKLEERIKAIIESRDPNDSLIIKSFIVQKDDEKLELTERREKQIRRGILANYVIEMTNAKLNGFKGKKAFVISWLYSALIFLCYSIFFFSFLNYQLYQIDHANFKYTGTYPSFDFVYYTFKTITFGDIELVKPISVLARISEMTSFFIMGIFLLVIFISVFFSLKQEKMNEDVKLTSELITAENVTLTKYFQQEFGMEMKSAVKEVKNLDESLRNLKKFIDKLF